MSFPYFIDKAAPVSGVRSLMDYEVTFIGQILKGEQCFAMKVLVPVTSLCPCSKKISDYGAHNQRSHVTVTAHTSDFVWIEEIIDLVEKQASSRALRPAQAPRREVRHRARLRQPEVRRGHGARRRRAAQPRRAHHALRGRVGELRVDPQPQRLRADREGQTRASSASAGPGLVRRRPKPRTSPRSARAWSPKSRPCTPKPAPKPACARMSPRGARGHGQGRAPPPGARRRSEPRLPQPPAADRQRPDHLAAVHRRAVDRSARTRSRSDVVLEVGTGSGYQAAVLAEIVSRVYSIELIESLGRAAAEASGRTRLRQYRSTDRRRLRGLAGEGAVRRHRGHRRGAARAAGAGRSAQARRAHGDPGRRRRARSST